MWRYSLAVDVGTIPNLSSHVIKWQRLSRQEVGKNPCLGFQLLHGGGIEVDFDGQRFQTSRFDQFQINGQRIKKKAQDCVHGWVGFPVEFVQISSFGACLETGSDRKERPEDPDSRFNKRRKGFSLICVFCDREKNRRAGLISSGPYLFKSRLGYLGSSCQCITSRFCFRNPKRKREAAAPQCCCQFLLQKGSLDFIRKGVRRTRASVPCGYGKTEKNTGKIFCQIVLQKLWWKDRLQTNKEWKIK